MAITINGNGTIDGISVGGIPDGVVDTDVLADNAVVFGKIGTTEQGQLCKAWVNFNGTGTVAIRAAYNVSSITDNGPGDYTVNFTTALVDANYSTVSTVGTQVDDGAYKYNTLYSNATYTSSGVRIVSRNASNNASPDNLINCVAIFR